LIITSVLGSDVMFGILNIVRIVSYPVLALTIS
jgi:hypothetical protein